MASKTTTAQQKIQQVHDAAAKYLPAGSTLQLNGQSVKLQDYLTVLANALATLAAEAAASSALAQAKSTRTAQLSAATAEMGALKTYLQSLWGKSSPQLDPFGFGAKARAPLTSAQKVLKAAKAKLTRNARGTKSKKQALKVTTSGTLGLALVQPDGTTVTGILPSAIAPAGAKPTPTTPAGTTAPASAPKS